MRTTAVVKFQIRTDRRARLRDALVGLEIDLLVLQCAPEPLDKHVVSPRPLSVHADRDVARYQNVGERIACELAALVGVKDLRPAIEAQSLLERELGRAS